VDRKGKIIRPTPDLTLREGDDPYIIGAEKELTEANKALVNDPVLSGRGL